LLRFDLFNTDGILGDKFLVNGKIEPVLHVSPRRYRFRWLTPDRRAWQRTIREMGRLPGNVIAGMDCRNA